MHIAFVNFLEVQYKRLFVMCYMGLLLLLGCCVPGLAGNHLPHARSAGKVFPESSQCCPGKFFVTDSSHLFSSHSVFPNDICNFPLLAVDHVPILLFICSIGDLYDALQGN